MKIHLLLLIVLSSYTGSVKAAPLVSLGKEAVEIDGIGNFSFVSGSKTKLLRFFGESDRDFIGPAWTTHGISSVAIYSDESCIVSLSFHFGIQLMYTFIKPGGLRGYEKTDGFQGSININGLLVDGNTTISDLSKIGPKFEHNVFDTFKVQDNQGRKLKFRFYKGNDVRKGKLHTLMIEQHANEKCNNSNA
jgi:hypothetical protein